VLLTSTNPYRGNAPEILKLDWDDFSFSISESNAEAIGVEAEWAVIAYLAADCSLAADIFDDLIEMKAIGSSAHMHVVALFDGPLLTDSFVTRLHSDTALADDVIMRWNELKTNEPATLAMAIELANAYPAKHRLLILGGHGSGWRGALIDENRGLAYQKPGRLILPGPGKVCDAKLQEAQRTAQARINTYLSTVQSPAPVIDLMALDACYMGNLEAVAFLAREAGILVCSEDLMPGQGLPYGEILKLIATNPSISPEELSRNLVEKTAAAYRAKTPPQDLTLVALRGDRLESLSDALVKLVQAIGPAPAGSDLLDTLQYAFEKSWSFSKTGMMDLKGFLQKLIENPLPAEAQDAARAALGAFEDIVIAFVGGGDSDTTNGLSIYAPAPQAFDVEYIKLSNQLPFDFGIWAWFLAGYYLGRLSTDAPTHPLIQSIQETMSELIATGEYRPGG
jgi:hypothetical protein